MGLSQRTPTSSVNDVLAVFTNELESSSRYLEYRAIHQKLLMNGFIIDHESVRLILKEHDPLGVEEGAQHCLSKRNYISTGPNHTWYIDGYGKLKPFRFAIHGAIDGYIRKILWLFVG